MLAIKYIDYNLISTYDKKSSMSIVLARFESPPIFSKIGSILSFILKSLGSS